MFSRIETLTLPLEKDALQEGGLPDRDRDREFDREREAVGAGGAAVVASEGGGGASLLLSARAVSAGVLVSGLPLTEGAARG